jgi:hypothetical protein
VRYTKHTCTLVRFQIMARYPPIFRALKIG